MRAFSLRQSAVREFVLDFGARLSRFRHDSDLSALNRNPGSIVDAPPLLRAAVRAGR
jgi:hypothetical protein